MWRVVFMLHMRDPPMNTEVATAVHLQVVVTEEV
jgi:hypothetical protein